MINNSLLVDLLLCFESEEHQDGSPTWVLGNSIEAQQVRTLLEQLKTCGRPEDSVATLLAYDDKADLSASISFCSLDGAKVLIPHLISFLDKDLQQRAGVFFSLAWKFQKTDPVSNPASYSREQQVAICDFFRRVVQDSRLDPVLREEAQRALTTFCGTST